MAIHFTNYFTRKKCQPISIGLILFILLSTSLLPIARAQCGMTIVIREVLMHCPPNSPGSFEALVSGGVAPYTYKWYGNTPNGLMFLGSGQMVTIPIGFSFNSFQVEVMGSNGCVQTQTSSAYTNDYLIANVSTTPAMCGSANGTMVITGITTGFGQPCSGGYYINVSSVGNFFTAGNSLTVHGLSSGYHALVISPTACNVCNYYDPWVLVGSSSAITASISASGPTTFCTGGNVILTASPAGTYLWSTGASSASITATTSGTYSVTVTASGCSGTASQSVSVQSIPSAAITPSGATTFCAGGNVTLTASPTGTYLWSTGATSASIVVANSGNYQVSVTNGLCTGVSLPLPVIVNSLPVISFDPIAPMCENNSSTPLSATPNGGSFNGTGVNGNSFNPTQAGAGTHIVSYTVTDNSGCTATATRNAVVTPSPTISIGAGSIITSCSGATQQLIATTTGAAGLQWYSVSAGLIAGATATTFVATQNGIYYAEAVNTCGISTSNQVSVSLSSVLAFNTSFTHLSCFGVSGGSITFSATGGTSPYQYSIDGGSTYFPFVTFPSLGAGTFSTRVRDAAGCVAAVQAVTLSAPPQLSISVSTINVSLPGGSDGSATASATGGTPPYSFSWNSVPAQLGNTASGLTAGNYLATVSDANGCSATSNFTITQPAANPCSGAVFRSGEQADWGANAAGTNLAAFMNANFNTAFPGGLVVGDCGRMLQFTSAAAVKAFILSNGSLARLKNGTMVNPTANSYKNTLAAQVVALTLNVVFDDLFPAFAPANFKFKDLVVNTGPFAGMSVGQLLAEANFGIGCGGSKPYLIDLSNTLALVNLSWRNSVNQNTSVTCPAIRLAITMQIPIAEKLTKYAYPNPTTGTVTILTAFEESAMCSIAVKDITGKVVISEQIKTAANGQVQLQLGALLPGIYLVSIGNGTYAEHFKVMLNK